MSKLGRDFTNLRILFQFLAGRKKLEPLGKVKTVHGITFRGFAPEGGKGGGSAVLSCQKMVLGDKYKDLELKYTFEKPNKFSRKMGRNELWDLWGGVLFAMEETAGERDTVYITHDYGTAFGLYLMGKKYVTVCHLQGPRVEEKINFGEKFSWISKKIIQFCEKKAFANAYYVCFPSEGAYKYFCQSKFKTIGEKAFKCGPVLYNTLYAFPTAEVLGNITSDKETITFLSAGQLTTAKGMDRHPAFFAELLKKSSRRIRYIFVGGGPLKEQMLKELEALKQNFKNFEYIHVEGCPYANMRYLQDIADVYLMLHRISIFDLATLEMMNKAKAVILSDAGGNKEFNVENNILLFEKDYAKLADDFLAADLRTLGNLNKKVYDNRFSNDCFKAAYHFVIDDLTEGETNV